MRLDVFLTQNRLVRSRSEAAKLIAESNVLLDGVPCLRAAAAVPEDMDSARITVNREAHPYVSRGGEKLAAALAAFRISPRGRVALDIGASSGGFTDCLLQHGAERVFAVDSGEGQLVPALREDPRVLVYEHYNARFLKAADFPCLPSFAVMDVSFISATLIFPSLAALLSPETPFICLIKPQFEVGRAGLGKGGIVREEGLRRKAKESVCASAAERGFFLLGTIDSPIPGGDGNLEYLAAFIRR